MATNIEEAAQDIIGTANNNNRLSADIGSYKLTGSFKLINRGAASCQELVKTVLSSRL